MKPVVCITSAVLLLIGSACQKQEGTVLGKAPKGEIQSILAVREGLTPPEITLRGVLVEKCPPAGCWFYLQDGTGILKVDTKAAGFVVTEVPVPAEVTVSGKLVYEGSRISLSATGLRY